MNGRRVIREHIFARKSTIMEKGNALCSRIGELVFAYREGQIVGHAIAYHFEGLYVVKLILLPPELDERNNEEEVEGLSNGRRE